MSAEKHYGTKEERQKAEHEAKVQRLHDLRIKELRGLLQDRAFRRHTWRQINLCGVYQYGFDGSARVHYSEGRRSVGMEILQDINEADPTVEGLMRKEAMEDEKANA